MILALVVSITSAQHGVLEFYVHVPEHSRGISVSVGCEAENSPVMDEGRELDGSAHQEHFRFVDVPGGSRCIVNVNVLVDRLDKHGKVHEDYEQGQASAVMSF